MASRRPPSDDDAPDHEAEVAAQTACADRVIERHAPLFQALADYDRRGDDDESADFCRLDVVEAKGPVAVIGDIHGRADLLALLLAKLGDLPVFVVGDVCDRGPDTREVIEQLIARGARGVRGNHEDWLCQFVDGRGFDSVALSAMFGGAATLRSYGIEGRSPREIEAQRFKVPLAHREWLSALPAAIRLLVDGAPYWIAHAGVPLSLAVSIDPVRRMREILPEHHWDLRWSALDPDNMDVLDGPVIYGHVPGEEPVDAGHAIGIDTGCGRSDGALTAVVLPARRFVTVRSGDP